jgi:ribosomal protein S18 acetylase RimI-like enzyme
LKNPDGVSLRPAAESDHDFLRALFASTRQRELAFFPHGAVGRALFIDGQFNAQCNSYRHAFPLASHEIIEVNAVAAGRLYIDRAGAAFHLIDISLLPEYRGRGIGTMLLRGLLAEAANAGSTVRLSVALSNPAQRLYQRLGFRTVDSDGVHLFQAVCGNRQESL